MLQKDFSTQSARIKFILYYFDLTQGELAKAIETTHSHISQMMSEKILLSTDIVKKLSKTYNLDCNWLILGEGAAFRVDNIYKNPLYHLGINNTMEDERLRKLKENIKPVGDGITW